MLRWALVLALLTFTVQRTNGDLRDILSNFRKPKIPARKISNDPLIYSLELPDIKEEPKQNSLFQRPRFAKWRTRRGTAFDEDEPITFHPQGPRRKRCKAVDSLLKSDVAALVKAAEEEEVSTSLKNRVSTRSVRPNGTNGEHYSQAGHQIKDYNSLRQYLNLLHEQHKEVHKNQYKNSIDNAKELLQTQYALPKPGNMYANHWGYNDAKVDEELGNHIDDTHSPYGSPKWNYAHGNSKAHQYLGHTVTPTVVAAKDTDKISEMMAKEFGGKSLTPEEAANYYKFFGRNSDKQTTQRPATPSATLNPNSLPTVTQTKQPIAAVNRVTTETTFVNKNTNNQPLPTEAPLEEFDNEDIEMLPQYLIHPTAMQRKSEDIKLIPPQQGTEAQNPWAAKIRQSWDSIPQSIRTEPLKEKQALPQGALGVTTGKWLQGPGEGSLVNPPYSEAPKETLESPIPSPVKSTHINNSDGNTPKSTNAPGLQAESNMQTNQTGIRSEQPLPIHPQQQLSLVHNANPHKETEVTNNNMRSEFLNQSKERRLQVIRDRAQNLKDRMKEKAQLLNSKFQEYVKSDGKEEMNQGNLGNKYNIFSKYTPKESTNLENIGIYKNEYHEPEVNDKPDNEKPPTSLKITNEEKTESSSKILEKASSASTPADSLLKQTTAEENNNSNLKDIEELEAEEEKPGYALKFLKNQIKVDEPYSLIVEGIQNLDNNTGSEEVKPDTLEYKIMKLIEEVANKKKERKKMLKNLSLPPMILPQTYTDPKIIDALKEVPFEAKEGLIVNPFFKKTKEEKTETQEKLQPAENAGVNSNVDRIAGAQTPLKDNKPSEQPEIKISNGQTIAQHFEDSLANENQSAHIVTIPPPLRTQNNDQYPQKDITLPLNPQFVDPFANDELAQSAQISSSEEQEEDNPDEDHYGINYQIPFLAKQKDNLLLHPTLNPDLVTTEKVHYPTINEKNQLNTNSSRAHSLNGFPGLNENKTTEIHKTISTNPMQATGASTGLGTNYRAQIPVFGSSSALSPQRQATNMPLSSQPMSGGWQPSNYPISNFANPSQAGKFNVNGMKNIQAHPSNTVPPSQNNPPPNVQSVGSRNHIPNTISSPNSLLQVPENNINNNNLYSQSMRSTYSNIPSFNTNPNSAKTEYGALPQQPPKSSNVQWPVSSLGNNAVNPLLQQSPIISSTGPGQGSGLTPQTWQNQGWSSYQPSGTVMGVQASATQNNLEDFKTKITQAREQYKNYLVGAKEAFKNRLQKPTIGRGLPNKGALSPKGNVQNSVPYRSLQTSPSVMISPGEVNANNAAPELLGVGQNGNFQHYIQPPSHTCGCSQKGDGRGLDDLKQQFSRTSPSNGFGEWPVSKNTAEAPGCKCSTSGGGNTMGKDCKDSLLSSSNSETNQGMFKHGDLLRSAAPDEPNKYDILHNMLLWLKRYSGDQNEN